MAFFTQLFPLIGSKLHLDLKTITILYTTSFVVLQGLVFFMVVHVLKNWRLGLCLLFLHSTVLTHTFYWIQSEYQQGLPLLILLFAIAQHIPTLEPTNRKTTWIYGMAILSFFVAFSHPLILFPTTFMFLFFMLQDWKNKSVYIYPYSSFLIFYSIKYFLFKTGYDAKSMEGMDNLFLYFPNYFTLPSNIVFLQYWIKDYYGILILMMVLCTVYGIDKQYLKAFFIVSFTVAYVLFINICYAKGADQFYIENMYLPVGLYLGMAIAYDVVDRIHWRYVWPLIALFFGIRLAHIYSTHTLYTNRLEFLESVILQMDKAPQKKNLIETTPDIKSTLIMDWATSYEIWLLSTIKRKATASIVITDNIQTLDWTLPHNKKFVTKWGAFDYSDFNSNPYFNFSDTSYYRKIDGKELRLTNE